MSIDEARDILFESTSVTQILDTYKDQSFVEFTCRAGGDVVTYRVYNDGEITER